MALGDSNQLVSVSASLPGGRKAKKSERDELAASKGCDAELITVSADIFNTYLKPIRNHQTQIRKEVSKYGLGWTSPWTCVPNHRIDEIIPALEAMKIENQEMWREFLRKYPDIVEERRNRMGVMFNESDFPDIEVLKHKWKVEINRDTLPDPERDIRAGWSDKEMRQMKQAMVELENRNVKAATVELLKRVRTPLSNIMDKAFRPEKKDGQKKDGRSGRFTTKTFIGNVRTIVEQLVDGNLRDDPEIESLRKEIIHDICGLDPTDLREDKTLMKNTGKKAEALVKKTDDLINRVSTFGEGLAL